ncbi:hypothetical protein BD309DRAFT_997599 [Dichomitus squalens]|nr:hypothetical protein BD309DRAFT_997599 [Dichomitus squalens]
MPTVNAVPSIPPQNDLRQQATHTQAKINVAAAQKLIQNEQYNESFLLLRDALQDPDSIDDVRTMALIHFPDLYMKMALLEDVELAARTYASEDVSPDRLPADLDYRMGNQIWGKPKARRWMRTWQAMIQVAVMMGDYGRAIALTTEILRINPSDNMGMRYTFGSILLLSGRIEDALSFSLAWINAKNGTPLRGGCAFERPTGAPLSQDVLAFHRVKCPWVVASEHFLTAALAAFRLWGDCGLARQCLSMGAHTCPIVMRRILGGSAKPHGPWIGPSDAGPEAARDYLWLAQDFWTTPNVLAWATSDKEVKDMLLQRCSREGCHNRETSIFGFKHCGNCHNKIYCGHECQKADWPLHKPSCRFVYRRYRGLEKKRVVPMNKLVSRVEDALIDCPHNIEFRLRSIYTSSDEDSD